MQSMSKLGIPVPFSGYTSPPSASPVTFSGFRSEAVVEYFAARGFERKRLRRHRATACVSSLCSASLLSGGLLSLIPTSAPHVGVLFWVGGGFCLVSAPVTSLDYE